MITETEIEKNKVSYNTICNVRLKHIFAAVLLQKERLVARRSISHGRNKRKVRGFALLVSRVLSKWNEINCLLRIPSYRLFTPLSREQEEYMRKEKETLGVAPMRLLPRKSGVRPITNMSERQWVNKNIDNRCVIGCCCTDIQRIDYFF